MMIDHAKCNGEEERDFVVLTVQAVPSENEKENKKDDAISDGREE